MAVRAKPFSNQTSGENRTISSSGMGSTMRSGPNPTHRQRPHSGHAFSATLREMSFAASSNAWAESNRRRLDRLAIPPDSACRCNGKGNEQRLYGNLPPDHDAGIARRSSSAFARLPGQGLFSDQLWRMRLSDPLRFRSAFICHKNPTIGPMAKPAKKPRKANIVATSKAPWLAIRPVTKSMPAPTIAPISKLSRTLSSVCIGLGRP